MSLRLKGRDPKDRRELSDVILDLEKTVRYLRRRDCHLSKEIENLERRVKRMSSKVYRRG